MKLKRSEIFARALADAGVKVFTSVPGFGATQIFDAWMPKKGGVFSFHEEVAFSVAHGAALTGIRAATTMKAHGFVKAMNSLMDALIAGTTAGLLIIVPEDYQGIHSDCILKLSPILQGMKIPVFDLNGSDIHNKVVNAILESEKKQLPVVAVCDSESLDKMESTHDITDPGTAPKWERNVLQQIVCPLLATYQYNIFQKKISGKNWRSLAKPELPQIPQAVPEQWRPIVEMYRPLFEVFGKLYNNMGVVTADTGISTLFAFPPFNCVDICTYMGGSVPLAIGASLAGYDNVWAISGDFSFVAAGHLGLLEAMHRQAPIKILILNNHSAQTTGGQPVPSNLLATVLAGFNDKILYIHDGQNQGEVRDALEYANTSAGLMIVVVEFAMR
ncbi:hypothetical protein JW935_09495 [candidate division KSB1 bacterium]|nr:hypothetical protein [candidate division KSB1 bacterium]